MGNCVRSVLRRLQRKRCSEKNIILLIVGLDNAGKSTVLNHITGDSDETVLPTMGFHTVSLKYKSYTIKIYDIGGSSQIRSLWPKYYNGIHGLIYVVDASDISRLTENKVVFGELISHEYISGKPLLLLANKQDVNGAIDELDVVENLDVERAANTMKCPTRVEICSCVWKGDQSKDYTAGIKNGYKYVISSFHSNVVLSFNKATESRRWLLDTVVKNYASLNSKIKSQDARNERNMEIESVDAQASDSPTRLSIGSNPFKPIKELLPKKEDARGASVSRNGTVPNDKKLKRIFLRRNKTGPLPTQEIIEIMPENVKFTKKSSIQTLPPILNSPTSKRSPLPTRFKTNRPCTAPGRTNIVNKKTVSSIPGQVHKQRF